MFNGMFGITHLSSAQTRSITAENVYGEKGRGGMADVSAEPQAEVTRIGQKWDGPNPCARDLGRTWKVRPCIMLPKQSTTTLMDVPGPGTIQHRTTSPRWPTGIRPSRTPRFRTCRIGINWKSSEPIEII